MHTYIYPCVQTHAFWEVGLIRRSEDCSLHPSLIHITNCGRVCMYMCNCVLRKT